MCLLFLNLCRECFAACVVFLSFSGLSPSFRSDAPQRHISRCNLIPFHFSLLAVMGSFTVFGTY